MPLVVSLALVLVLGCGLPPRPEFRPTTVEDREAVRAWLEDGQSVLLTHSYEQDQVDVSITLRRAQSTRLACVVVVDNRSQHDAIIDFVKTTIEDTEHGAWTLDGTAFSVEANNWSGEWRVAPGESGTFNAVYVRTESVRHAPAGVSIQLHGFIGPYELIDTFDFARIVWP